MEVVCWEVDLDGEGGDVSGLFSVFTDFCEGLDAG